MSKKETETITLLAFGAIVVIPAIVAWGGFWAGLAISVLWGWFVVPLGVVDIGLLHAYGLALLFSAFTLGSKIGKDSSDAVMKTLIVYPCAALLLIAVGWFVQAWM